MMPPPQALGILYVEDDASMAALVQKNLRRNGYAIHCAETGADALKMWHSRSFDVLLLDHGLPDMTGLEVIRTLSRRGPLPPIVMITAAGDEKIAVQALKLGASDYVVKDVNLVFLELLPAAIEQALARQRLGEENRAAKEALEKAYASLEIRVQEATRDLVSAMENLQSEVDARRETEAQLQKQHSFLHTVLESLTHPLYVVDANDYTIRMANSAARSQGSIEKTKCYASTHGLSEPCKGPDHLCPVEQVKRTKASVTAEHVHFGPEAAHRVVEIHAYPIFRGDGTVGEVVQSVLDITGRRQAENSLRDLLEMSSNIIQNIPSGLLIFQYQAPNEFFLVNANLEATKLTGITVKEWRGQEFDEMWPNARTYGLVQACVHTMETGETFRTDAFVFRNRIGQRLFRIRAFQLPGNLLGLSFEDVTESRQADQAPEN
jgi:DNA-binding response OmpR family regulator